MEKLLFTAVLSVYSLSAMSGDFDSTLESLLKNFDTGIYAEDRNTNDKGCSVYARDISGFGKLYLSILGLDDKSTLQTAYEGQTISFGGKSYESKISHFDNYEGTTYVVESYDVLTKEKFCTRVLFGGDPCIKTVGVIKEVSEIKVDKYGDLLGFTVEEFKLRNTKFKKVEEYSCY